MITYAGQSPFLECLALCHSVEINLKQTSAMTYCIALIISHRLISLSHVDKLLLLQMASRGQIQRLSGVQFGEDGVIVIFLFPHPFLSSILFPTNQLFSFFHCLFPSLFSLLSFSLPSCTVNKALLFQSYRMSMKLYIYLVNVMYRNYLIGMQAFCQFDFNIMCPNNLWMAIVLLASLCINVIPLTGC